jgi:predicted RNase H-like nuclease (RuvC/YqgF family)
MKPVSRPIIALLSIWMGLCLAGSAFAQSLGELARQERAKKNQQAPKGGKVYTNSDIPAPALAGAPPAEAAAEPAADQKEAAKPGTEGSKAAAGEKTPEELEKEYRDKFAKLREAQDLDERKLDVMQRELNLMQTQYSSDPNVTLQQELTRDNINKRTADIETQKAAVDKAKQAVTDLEEELRAKSLPAGWAR